jgi:hypothetical protein
MSENLEQPQGKWKWITPTQCVLDNGEIYARAINVRPPYINEPGGTRYVVSGPGHTGAHIFETLEDAVAAAEGSL